MSFDELPADSSLAEPLPPSPFDVLTRWLAEAKRDRVQRNPEAMALATADSEGRPSLRLVLCRGVDAERGAVTFYTNRESRKGRELAGRAEAAATFHWDALERQARLEGSVLVVPDAESDAYFATRPRAAQIAAWASAQSQAIESRQALLARLRETEARFGGPKGPPVPRPPFWGGYQLVAERVELWVGSTGRVHDRVMWDRGPHARKGRSGDSWQTIRMQP